MRNFMNMLREKAAAYSTTGIVFLIIAGLLFLIWPKIAIMMICRLLGILLLVYGIITIVRSVRGNQGSVRYGGLILGVILSIFGVSVISNPFFLVRISGTLIALFILLYGIYSLIRLLRTGMERNIRWWFYTAGAVAEIIIGIMLLAAPVSMSAFVLRILGIIFLYAALSAVIYRKKIEPGYETNERNGEDPFMNIKDSFERFTGKNEKGKDIIDGTARDVTDDTDNYR